MWKKSEYTKAQINEAGRMIVDPSISDEQRKECLKIIDNWRAAHAYPMNTFAINLRRHVSDIEGAIVAQRLKRLDTICGKIERFPSMELYRMQDLAGCRVIVPTIDDVYKVKNSIETSRIRHERKKPKDYIKTPNPKTGYRGVHLIYKYKSEKNTAYNGMLVEIQVRTKLQHLWATAVEMVGFFTDNGLKFNQGSEDWILYFKLLSELFAVEEETSPDKDDFNYLFTLIENILNLEKKLDAVNVMKLIALGSSRINSVEKKIKSGYFLLIFNQETNNLDVHAFEGVVKGLDAATEAYNKIEQMKGTKKIDVVLVSAQSHEMLVNAYPNYFSNISEFLNKEVEVLRKQHNRCFEMLEAMKKMYD